MKATAALLLFLSLTGCGLPFSRPTPSEEEYRQRYLDMLDTGQIRDLRFAYDGDLSSASSIARFVTDASGLQRIRAAADREEAYEPSSEVARRELRRRFEDGGLRELPEWFDLPFTKPLLMIVNQDAGDSNGRPPYSCQWYVDEQTCTVYFLTAMGDAAQDDFELRGTSE